MRKEPVGDEAEEVPDEDAEADEAEPDDDEEEKAGTDEDELGDDKEAEADEDAEADAAPDHFVDRLNRKWRLRARVPRGGNLDRVCTKLGYQSCCAIATKDGNHRWYR